MIGLCRRVFAAAANLSGRPFGMLAASSIIASSTIIGAAVSGGESGLLAALAASGGTPLQASTDARANQPAAGPGGPSSIPAGPTAQQRTTTVTTPQQTTTEAPPTGTATTPTTTTSTTPTTTTTPTTPTVPAANLGRVKHTFVIALSSPGYDETFGDQSQMPYLAKTLRPDGELLSNYSLLTTAGLPNYIAMVSGQPPNRLTKNDCPTYKEFPANAAPNEHGIVPGAGCVYPVQSLTVADQIGSGGYQWRAYMEDMVDDTGAPHNCVHPGSNEADNPSQGGYAARQNPFVYFHSLLDLGDCGTNDEPLDQLKTDLKKASTTPNYSFISPNLCHAGVDGQCADQTASAPASADDFLAQWVPLIRKSPGFKHDGLVIITFGEAQPPEGAADPKRVGALLLSPYVTPGATDATAYNPYSVLRTTEDLFGIAPLVYAGSSETNSFSAGLLGGD